MHMVLPSVLVLPSFCPISFFASMPLKKKPNFNCNYRTHPSPPCYRVRRLLYKFALTCDGCASYLSLLYEKKEDEQVMTSEVAGALEVIPSRKPKVLP